MGWNKGPAALDDGGLNAKIPNTENKQDSSSSSEDKSNDSNIVPVGTAEQMEIADVNFIANLNKVTADEKFESFSKVIKDCNILRFADAVATALTDDVRAGAYAATALTEQYGSLYIEGEQNSANVHLVYPYRNKGDSDIDEVVFIDIPIDNKENVYNKVIKRTLTNFESTDEIVQNLSIKDGVKPKAICLLQTGISLKDVNRETSVLDINTYNKSHLVQLLSTTYSNAYDKYTDGVSATRVYADYAVVNGKDEDKIIKVISDYSKLPVIEQYCKKILPRTNKLFTGSHFLSLIYSNSNSKIALKDIESIPKVIKDNWFLQEMCAYFKSGSIYKHSPNNNLFLRAMEVQYLPTLQAAFMTGCVPEISLYYEVLDKDENGKPVKKKVTTTWEELLSFNSNKTLLWHNYSVSNKAVTYLNNTEGAEPCCDYTVMPKCEVDLKVAKNNQTADFKQAVTKYIVDLCTQIIGYLYYNAYQLDVQQSLLYILAAKTDLGGKKKDAAETPDYESDVAIEDDYIDDEDSDEKASAVEGSVGKDSDGADHTLAKITVYSYVQLLKKIRRLVQSLTGNNDDTVVLVLNHIIKTAEFVYRNKQDKEIIAVFDGKSYVTLKDGKVIQKDIIDLEYNRERNTSPNSLYEMPANLCKVLEEINGVTAREGEKLYMWISSSFCLYSRLSKYYGDTELCSLISGYWTKVLKRRVAQLLTNVIYVSNFNSGSKGVYRCRLDTFGYKSYNYTNEKGFDKIALYERADGNAEKDAYEHSLAVTDALSGDEGETVENTGLHPCTKLFGNESQGIVCATAKGSMCDFVLCGEGSFDKKYAELNYCGSFAYVFNMAEYKNSTLFGYKALEMMYLAGVKPSVETCYIGQNMDGSFRSMDLTTADISLSAGSRSGKGTVTNCIIASMVASKSSIIYVDGKPDVSGNIMNLGRYFGAPVLTAECLALPYLEYGSSSSTANFKFKPIGGVDSTWFNSYSVKNKFSGMPGEPEDIYCGIHDLKQGEKLNRFKYAGFEFKGISGTANNDYESLLQGIIDKRVELDGGEKGTVAPALVLLKMLNLIGFINKTDIAKSNTPYLSALRGMYCDKAPRIFLFIDEINNISLSLSKALAWILANLYIAPVADACVNTVNPFGREGGKTGEIHSAKVWNDFKLMLRLPKQGEHEPSPEEQIRALRRLEGESMKLGLVTSLFNMLNLYIAKGSSDKIKGTGNATLRTVYVGQHIAADKLRSSAAKVKDCINWFTSADASGGVSNLRGFTYYKLANTGWLADENMSEPTNLDDSVVLNSNTYLDTLLLKKTTSPDNIRIRGRAYLSAERDKCTLYMGKHNAVESNANVMVDNMQSDGGYLDLTGNIAKEFLEQTGMFGIARSGEAGLDKNLFKSYAVFNTNDIFDNLVCSVLDGGLAENLFGTKSTASVGFILLPEVISSDTFALYAECMTKDRVEERRESYNNGKPINLKVIRYAPKVISGKIGDNYVELEYCKTDSAFDTGTNCFKFKVGSTTDVIVKTNIPGREIMSCRLFEAVKCNLNQFVEAVNRDSSNIHKAFIDICIGNLSKYNVGLSVKELSNAIVGRTLLELDKEFKPIAKLKNGWNYVFKDLVVEIRTSDGNGGIITYLAPRSEVGFLDYIKTFVKYFACDNGNAKLDEFADSLGYGYWLVTALLKDTGIIGQGTPYVTIEDWLYDYSTSSFFPLLLDTTIYKRMLQDFGIKPYDNAACKVGIATNSQCVKEDPDALSEADRAMVEQFDTSEGEGAKSKPKKTFSYVVKDCKGNFDALLSYIFSKLEDPNLQGGGVDIATIKAYHDLYIECSKFIANGYKLADGIEVVSRGGSAESDFENSTAADDLDFIYEFLQQSNTVQQEEGGSDVQETVNSDEPIRTNVQDNQDNVSGIEEGNAFNDNVRFVADWSAILNASNLYESLNREWNMFFTLQSEVQRTGSMNITQVQKVVEELRNVTSSIVKNTEKLNAGIDFVSDRIDKYSMDDIVLFIQENTELCASLLESVGHVDISNITVDTIIDYFENAAINIGRIAVDLNNVVNSQQGN